MWVAYPFSNPVFEVLVRMELLSENVVRPVFSSKVESLLEGVEHSFDQLVGKAALCKSTRFANEMLVSYSEHLAVHNLSSTLAVVNYVPLIVGDSNAGFAVLRIAGIGPAVLHESSFSSNCLRTSPSDYQFV